MKKLFFLTLVLSFVSAACPNASVHKPPPIKENGECNLAERHLLDLCSLDTVQYKHCCAVVKPTKKGLTFTQFCQETMEKGIDLHPDCLAGISSCEEIEVCTKSK